MSDNTIKLLELINSKEYVELENYYKRETIFDILGITRKETCHSNFLKWMLDVNGSHGIGEYPLRKFLELLIISDKSKIADEELFKVIVTGTYRLADIEINREKMTDKKDGFIDLFVRFKISYNDTKDKTINLIIENKIESGPNGKQLVKYEKFAKSITKENTKTLLIYIYPEYNDSVDHDGYLKVTYQKLISKVLEPCSIKMDGEKSKQIIEDYICSIGLPRIVDNGKNKSNYNIIATGAYETKLIKNLWDEHKDILKQINDSLYNLFVKKEPTEEDNIMCSFYYYHIAILKPLFKLLNKKELNFVLEELILKNNINVNRFNNDNECINNPELIKKVIDNLDEMTIEIQESIKDYFAGVPLFYYTINHNEKDFEHPNWYKKYKDKWILVSFTDTEIKRFITFLNIKGFSIERYR